MLSWGKKAPTCISLLSKAALAGIGCEEGKAGMDFNNHLQKIFKISLIAAN